MSRIRSTLDTVSKAVSGTVSGTDLLSKITRLKPGTSTTAAAAAAGKAGTVEVHLHGTSEQEAATVSMTAAAVQSAVAMETPNQDKRHEEEVPEQGVMTEQVEVPHVRVREKMKISLASQAGTVSSSMAKQTFQRLQPAAFSTNMDETYSHLSQHVNTYFGSDSPADPAESQLAQQRKSPETAAPSAQGLHPNHTVSRDHIPVLMPVAGKASNQASPESPALEHTSPSTPTPTSPAAPKPEIPAPAAPSASPRKGISHYLSYPRPSVQSFVGSYIAPLVPKFRADSQSAAAAEKAGKPQGSDQVATQDGREKTEEEKEAEDKAQRLLSQRERVGSQGVI